MSPDLVRSAQSGNADAMNKIIHDMEPLVHHIAQQRPAGIYFNDFVQAGRIGVMVAVRETDFSGSFTSYAGTRISREMLRLHREIRGISHNDQVLLSRYYKRARIIEQREQRDPVMNEVFDELKLQPSQRDILKGLLYATSVSIDAEDYSINKTSWQHHQEAGKVFKDGRIKFIAEMINELTETNAFIFRSYYLEGMTQAMIAKKLSWTPDSVGGKVKQIRDRFKVKWPRKLFDIAYSSPHFFDANYSFHLEIWRELQGVKSPYLVSNYGRVKSYDVGEERFHIKKPNTDRGNLRYRFTNQKPVVNLPSNTIISNHFEFKDLPTFYTLST